MLKKLKQMFVEEDERLFLWVPVLFGLGIGLYFLLPIDVSNAVLVVVTELLILGMYLKRHSHSHLVFFAALLILLFGFSYIKLYTIYQTKHVKLIKENETTYLQGRIKQIDYTKKGNLRFLLTDVSDFEKPRVGNYRISSAEKSDFKIGTCIETVANIMPVSHPLKPDGFEFDRYAFYQGISGVGYAIASVYEIDCPKIPWYASVLTYINQSRKNISSYIQKILPKNEAAIASAVLVGDKSYLSQIQYEKYRDSGLAHFLAISGLHLGLVAAFAFFSVRLLMSLIPTLALRYSSKTVACVFAVGLSFVYLLLSGVSVSALRAFVMTAVVFLGFIYDRNAISMRMVAFAALVILILEPYFILSAGFQMSFAAVVALISFYEVLSQKELLKKNKNVLQRIFFYFGGVVLTSLIASLATMPFGLYHFGTFSPYVVIGNVISAPVIAFMVMPFVFLSLVLLPFHLSSFPLHVAGLGFKWLNDITTFISALPSAGMMLPRMPLIGVILITLGGLWLCLWQRKWRLLGLIPIILGILSYTLTQKPDILYSADAKTIGIQTPKNELLVFSLKKNAFLVDVWGGDFKKIEYSKNPLSNDKIGLICKEQKCVYRGVFAFDLKGNLSLEGKPLDTTKNLGGAIYLNKSGIIHKTVRKTIGNKPWGAIDI